MLKRVDVATYDFIKSVVDGKPKSGYTTFTLKDDGVGYSTSGNFLSKDTIAKINEYKDSIISGKDQGAREAVTPADRPGTRPARVPGRPVVTYCQGAVPARRRRSS
ncbi:MAG: hypothetical protein PGN07_02560 [Aeromicrobium erythreum]